MIFKDPHHTSFDYVLRETRYGLIFMPPKDEFMSTSLALTGEYTPAYMDLLRVLVRPGMTVVDAGANIGIVSLVLSDLVGLEGQVWSFEPQPILNRVMVANLAMNMCNNVRVLCQGLSDRERAMRVPIIDTNIPQNTGIVSFVHDPYSTGMVVRFVPLDMVGLPGLDLLKVDVEGMEWEVVQGARKLIDKYQPWMLLEHDRPPCAAKILDLVHELEYTPYWYRTHLVTDDNWYHNRVIPENMIIAGSFDMLCVPKNRHAPVLGLEEVHVEDELMKAPLNKLASRLIPIDQEPNASPVA